MFERSISIMSTTFKEVLITHEFIIRDHDKEIPAVLLAGKTNKEWDSNWNVNEGKYGAYILTPQGYANYEILEKKLCKSKDQLINELSFIKEFVNMDEVLSSSLFVAK